MLTSKKLLPFFIFLVCSVDSLRIYKTKRILQPIRVEAPENLNQSSKEYFSLSAAYGIEEGDEVLSKSEPPTENYETNYKSYNDENIDSQESYKKSNDENVGNQVNYESANDETIDSQANYKSSNYENIDNQTNYKSSSDENIDSQTNYKSSNDENIDSQTNYKSSNNENIDNQANYKSPKGENINIQASYKSLNDENIGSRANYKRPNSENTRRISSNSQVRFPKRTDEKSPVVPIIEKESYVFAYNGDYHYSYKGGDGTQAFERGDLKADNAEDVVVGGYSYKDKDGNDYSLTYTAGENGYRPVGAHLPTPPPIPPAIQRVLRILATKTTPAPVTESLSNDYY